MNRVIRYEPDHRPLEIFYHWCYIVWFSEAPTPGPSLRSTSNVKYSCRSVCGGVLFYNQAPLVVSECSRSISEGVNVSVLSLTHETQLCDRSVHAHRNVDAQVLSFTHETQFFSHVHMGADRFVPSLVWCGSCKLMGSIFKTPPEVTRTNWNTGQIWVTGQIRWETGAGMRNPGNQGLLELAA